MLREKLLRILLLFWPRPKATGTEWRSGFRHAIYIESSVERGIGCYRLEVSWLLVVELILSRRCCCIFVGEGTSAKHELPRNHRESVYIIVDDISVQAKCVIGFV